MSLVNWVPSDPLTQFKKYQLSSWPVWIDMMANRHDGFIGMMADNLDG